MRNPKLLWFICVLAGICSNTIHSQINDVEQKGRPFNGSFLSGDVDTVNVQNGNLHIAIPLAAVKQRGGSEVTYSLVFDTQAWIKRWLADPCSGSHCTNSGQYNPETNDTVPSGWRVVSSLDWQFDFQQTDVVCPTVGINYDQYTNWVVIDPEGGSHPLALRKEVGLNCSGQTMSGPTLDGSGLTFDINSTQIRAKDGSILGRGTRKDANGNLITSTLDTLGRSLMSTTVGPTITYTTPLGNTTQGPQYTRYTFTGSNGEQEQYEIDYAAVDVSSDVCTKYPMAAHPCEDFTSSPTLVFSKLILPTHKSYEFNYANNTPGDLSSLKLPTGAIISYTYDDLYQPHYTPGGKTTPDVTGGRTVSTRTVTRDGITEPSTTYAINGTSSTVHDPAGNTFLYTFNLIAAGPSGQPKMSSNRYLTQRTIKDASGYILKRVDTSYEADVDLGQNVAINVRPIREVVTLDSGQQMAKETDYETFTYNCPNCNTSSGIGIGVATRLNPIEERFYDYGPQAPGPLIKRIDYSYLHSNNGIYQSANIVDRVTDIAVYNGAGTKVSEEAKEYDVYSHVGQPMLASSAAQHDASYGTNFTARGNLTAISQWRDTDGTFATTSRQFDDAGNLLSTIDAGGHQTTYDYSDLWSNAACAPSGGTGKAFVTKSTNALGQYVRMSYNSCTGTVAVTEDVNRNASTISYGILNRVVHIAAPDGGSTDMCYSDDPNGNCVSTSLYIRQSTAIKAGVNRIVQSNFDGLGRQIQTQLLSDPQGTVYQDTQYDLIGHPYKISNPHRASDSVFYTTVLYDALGRARQTNYADGSLSFNTPIGNTTLTHDESGHQRKSAVDAFGRVASVWEDPAGANIETDYSYDVRGNLLRVVQMGGVSSAADWRVRSFTYNSLGQLLCAANPEIGQPGASLAACPTTAGGPYISGTTKYTYDASGNLSSKISPQPSQVGAASLTTTYSYDALNRLTSKSYSDGTRTQHYSYDGKYYNGSPAPVPFGANAIGKLTQTSDLITVGSLLAYDPMGRIIQNQDVDGGVVSYTSAQYDLAGNQTTLTYPSGRQVVKTYDSAGRLSSVTGGGSNPGYSYVSAISYFPDGTPQFTVYGNGVTETLSQNSRLQPCEATVAKGSSTYLDRQYFYATNNTPGTQCSPVAGNNGNVWNIGDGLGGSYNQSFTYDALNRLGSWTAPNMAGAYRHLDYLYDSFGNLVQSGSGTATNPASLYTVRNQLQGWWFECTGLHGETGGYDAAGNTLCSGQQNVDAKAFVWDAESRIAQLWSQQNNNTYNQSAAYLYDADGQRVRSEQYGGGTLQSWRQYVRFGGQTVSELDQSGAWTDYIDANGRRVAMVKPAEWRVHLHGKNQRPVFGGGGLTISPLPRPLQSGDKLVWRQFNGGSGVSGGLFLDFTNQTNDAWSLNTNDGFYGNTGGGANAWVSRVADLSPDAGKMPNVLSIVSDYGTQPGTWDIWFADVAIIGTDGMVQPLFRKNSIALPNSVWLNDFSAQTESSVCIEYGSSCVSYTSAQPATAPGTGITWLIADQVGTAQMEFSNEGWPVWKGEFNPFGLELDNTATLNRYKFTGKERDTESGLDYFGARYYASNMGRFISPDWASTPTAVPYANFVDPQSLNLYSYVENSPVNRADVNGHVMNVDISLYGSGNGDSFENYVTASGIFAAQKGIFGESFMTDEDVANMEADQQQKGSTVKSTQAQQQNTTTPVQTGVQWLTGTGLRSQTFHDGDPFTEQLRHHDNVQEVINGVRDGSLPPNGDHDYNLGGVKGVGLYLRDYSTLLTGGATGNLAVTYLGSYSLHYTTSDGVITMTVKNTSTLGSATHLPIFGYTSAGQSFSRFMTGLSRSGPMSPTTQTFIFHENVVP